ncbi:transport protein [Ceratobasidium theobromae]|uniref:Transport protein n=1 Tax=Ceratobasidium theobromae TaxID=1582974 RepID=A0A5N5Q8T4_9AGAM|nr:transport protein [Ceratobasidium theobromae]
MISAFIFQIRRAKSAGPGCVCVVAPSRDDSGSQLAINYYTKIMDVQDNIQLKTFSQTGARHRDDSATTTLNELTRNSSLQKCQDEGIENGPGQAEPTSRCLVGDLNLEYAAMALPPVDRGFKAWSFVAAAFVLETLVWGFGFTYGVFQEYFLHQQTFGDASEAAVGAVGTAALAIQYFEVLLVILLAQQWPDKTRLIMWSSLGLCCGSLLLASFATKIWHMILLQGILFGIGGGGLYAPVIIYLSEWFVARRGLAGAIIFGGSGAGGAFFPIVVNFLLTHLGFRWTLRIWAGFMLIFGALALTFTRPRLPVVRAHDADGLGLLARLRRQHWGFLKSPLFLCMTATIFIQALAYFPVSLYMAVYTSSLGLPPLNGTLVLSVFNLASIIGQIAFGHVCDNAPYAYAVIVSGAGAALSAYLLWGFAHSLGLIFAFVVVFGSLSGGFGSVWPAACIEIAGSEQSSVSNIFGFFSMTKGVAAIIGPLIAAALHHPEQAAMKSIYSGYGFRDVTLFVGSMMVATAAGGVVSRLARRVTL